MIRDIDPKIGQTDLLPEKFVGLPIFNPRFGRRRDLKPIPEGMAHIKFHGEQVFVPIPSDDEEIGVASLPQSTERAILEMQRERIGRIHHSPRPTSLYLAD